eukprot:CAMPEP_0119133064 /NCGR_PEP_ID=MMETSP1310-20130426/12917_1 /TAXON_ID=464262 /ORGANISM="Genus nov. species nov., Strain RCC2339" /LENGTH=209 /DNA_ID=CAMNT_0007123737 /DNA_START=98 /DNA_END=730 /DNA_ORIENTATION=-
MASNPEGEAFLEANAQKPGVHVTPSGLQYKILESGSGGFHPTVNSPCSCHYHGTLISGEVFDSSMDRGTPITFAPNQVIKGWTEIMQMMVEGDLFEIYVPSQLAYGERGSPPKIGPNEVLIFKIQILEIQGDKVPANRCDVDTLEGCDDKEKVYVGKIREKIGSGFDVAGEMSRLRKMSAGKMKSDLQGWILKRLAILEKLESASNDEL